MCEDHAFSDKLFFFLLPFKFSGENIVSTSER